MKIAIISDIHDHLENMSRVYEQLPTLEIEHVLGLGDFIHPADTSDLMKDSNIPHNLIFGNNDGEKVGWTRKADASNNITLANKDYDAFELAGKRICLIHHPDLAPSLARSGDFDAVFYGHNHLKKIEKVGDCWLVNPGEVTTFKSSGSFAVWDTDNDEIEIIDL